MANKWKFYFHFIVSVKAIGIEAIEFMGFEDYMALEIIRACFFEKTIKYIEF